MAGIFVREVGGFDAVGDFEERVAAGITAFIRFSNLVLDEYVVRSGATVHNVEPYDPRDPGQGWRVVD